MPLSCVRGNLFYETYVKNALPVFSPYCFFHLPDEVIIDSQLEIEAKHFILCRGFVIHKLQECKTMCYAKRSQNNWKQPEVSRRSLKQPESTVLDDLKSECFEKHALTAHAFSSQD